MKKVLTEGIIVALVVFLSLSTFGWTLKEAAAPYKGLTITVVALERPSYVAMEKVAPQFEQITGIHVNFVTYPYEQCLEAETMGFLSHSLSYDAILCDVIWTGDFVTQGWVVPINTFLNNPALADPNIDMSDFFPVWLKAFTWNGVLYGLPFDSYSGVLYYNKEYLKEAGFDQPPQTWEELINVYLPKLQETLSKQGIYPFALQSARGETQSCDSFARFLNAWNGGLGWLYPKTFLPTVDSTAAIAAMEARQQVVKYGPKSILNDDHAQVIALMGEGEVAMITEWTSFYTTLASSATSKIYKDLGVALEPAGPYGREPAFGGFAYMVNSQIPKNLQDATWLFIQWLTSKEEAPTLVKDGAVVARKFVYNDPQLIAEYPYLKIAAESWDEYSKVVYRPRLPEYPAISLAASRWGSAIEDGSVSIEYGLQQLYNDIYRILNSAGYYSGKVPLEE